ncbi:response regulator [Pseudomonas stutzeri]|nr:response regulator [Stutzerimonas stutzeri]
MRIASCSKLIASLVAALLLASLGASLLHGHLLQERDRSRQLLADSLSATDWLLLGSDRLTAAARAYAVTGTPHHRQAFERELTIYRHREQAGERLLALGASAEELELAASAKRRSDALLEVERQAFAAIDQDRRPQALALLYGTDYERAKSEIADTVEQVRSRIETRLRQHIGQLGERSRVAEALTVGLLGLTILVTLGVLQLFYLRRLIHPIASMTAKVRRLLAADGDGVRFDEGRPGSEIAELAQALEESRQAGLAMQAQTRQLAEQAAALAASEERRRQTESWYRGILESAPDAILVADADGLIRLANQRLEELFGYRNDELLGQPLASLAAPAARETFARLHRQAAASGRPLSGVLLEGRRRDGGTFPLEATLALLPSRAGAPRDLCAVLRDVAARQQAEHEMRQAREMAERAAQAKSDFLANISHEVRTPLNTIVGMSHLLGQTALHGPQDDYLRQIQQAGEQLRALVDDILDFSRIERGQLELQQTAFNPQELLDGLVGRFAERARSKGLRFACRADAALPAELVGDAQRIAQVLAQFLDNAIKFTQAGAIEIGVDGHRLSDRQIELDLYVRDTGIGLTAEQQAALFRSFYQADTSRTRQFGGTGLGLTLARKLAELLGGSVGAQSRHGEGSTFWLRVPLGVGSPNLQQLLPRLELQGRRVLLAEDHDVNQRLLCKLLEHVGVQVDVAENGRQAVERVRARDYDLVLMDMQMPVLDGAGATREIRALGPRGQLPIVAISASAMAEDRRRCRAAGMDGFLAKPIKVEELYATLRQWCRAPAAAAAPPPRPAAPDDAGLPTIPGLDSAEGLQRVMGDRALYRELLGNLLRREHDMPHRLRLELARGDHGAALRLAHTLKGLTATVGAGATSQAAAALEQELRRKAPAETLEAALVRLEEAFATLLEPLAQWLGTPAPVPTPPPAPGQLRRICTTLVELLQEDDAEAVTWFNANAAALHAALSEEYPELERALRSFEFASALRILQPLLHHPQPATPSTEDE